MIAITGANGNLGRATIEFLFQKVEPSNIIAIVRNPETIKDLREKGVLIRQADYNEYDELLRAFEDAEKVLQISTIGITIETAKRQEANVVNAIKANDVNQIIYTSMVQVQSNAIFQGTATQYHTEKLIRKSNIPYTFFRNSMYMEAIPELIGDALQTGSIDYPAGKGKVSFVSRMDIAEALANVMTGSDHKNRTYEITGAEAISFRQLAEQISTSKEMDINYKDIPIKDYREQLLKFEIPVEVVDLLVSMAEAIQVGEFSHTDDSLETLLERRPIALSEYLKNL